MRVRGRTGKYLLKKAMHRYLPADVLHRPKQGFVTPIADWFRGPLAGEAQGIATSAALARTGLFDTARLAGLADAHRSGRADHSRLLWQLLMLDRSLVRLGLAA
jgi:asparagine synthase (glutamine-hydrolysing)